MRAGTRVIHSTSSSSNLLMASRTAASAASFRRGGDQVLRQLNFLWRDSYTLLNQRRFGMFSRSCNDIFL